MTIRIVQYLDLTAFAPTAAIAQSEGKASTKDTVVYGTGSAFIHRYQNYFVNETKTRDNNKYGFMPFSTTGSISNLNGDNSLLSITFPNIPVAMRLLEQGNGNRLSRLTLSTVWLNEDLEETTKAYSEYYIGIGSTVSETTIELRFRSAMDSVGSQFPSRRLTRALVGLLPMNADLYLR